MDGDYPHIIHRDLVEWIPKDIITGFRRWHLSPLCGYFLQNNPDNDPIPQHSAAFTAHGFHLVHDEERCLKAAGRQE